MPASNGPGRLPTTNDRIEPASTAGTARDRGELEPLARDGRSHFVSTATLPRPERGILDATPAPLNADGAPRERTLSARRDPSRAASEAVLRGGTPRPDESSEARNDDDAGAPFNETPGTRDATAELDLDDALMGAVQAGDEAAFEQLVGRWQSRIVGYLTNMLGSRDDALDATQDTFIRLFTRADRHVPKGSFKAWLFRMATNVALDQIRRRKRRRWISLGEELLGRGGDPRGEDAPMELDPTAGVSAPEAHDARDGALGSVLEKERAACLHRALATLPPAYRSAVALKDLQDLGYEETATALGVSVGTVKSRVSRGRNLLREKLSTLIEPAPAPECRAGTLRRDVRRIEG